MQHWQPLNDQIKLDIITVSIGKILLTHTQQLKFLAEKKPKP